MTHRSFDDESALARTTSQSKAAARRRERVWLLRALVFAISVLAINALIGEHGLAETLRARREFQRTIAELSQLQYENAVLAEQIRRLRHDPRAIERVARAEMGLVRPGEVLVIVSRPLARDRRPLTRN
jgi:cell division protein FtsB